jgi:uncharacterized protein
VEAFADYLASIDHPDHRERMAEVLGWVAEKFPNLVPEVKWNQPMFTDHGTFIIGFSVSKQHMSVSPEAAGIVHYADEIVKAGYSHTANLFRIVWKQPVDYSLLERIIEFNIEDKADSATFWR